FSSAISVHSLLTSLYLHSFPTRRSSDLSGFTELMDFMRRGDLVWGACEVQFSTRGFRTDSEIAYLVPPRVGQDLGKAGFNVMTVDRKSTRLNSSHVKNSYAVFCLKKKKN